MITPDELLRLKDTLEEENNRARITTKLNDILLKWINKKFKYL